MNVVIVGGGMSGLMAAIEASKNHHVTLLERNQSCGKKVLVTGNRRCNITNNKSNQELISLIHNGKFLYSTFNTLSVNSIIEFYRDKGLDFIEEKDGRMYPSTERSSDVLKVLLKTLEDQNVDIKYNALVTDITLVNNVVTSLICNDEIIDCDHLIMATGGLSFPILGSDGTGHTLLEKKGVKITELYPVETALFSNAKIIKSCDLVGLSFQDIEIKVMNHKKIIYTCKDDILITHKGLSGPAALSCGEYAYKALRKNKDCSVILNLLPKLNQEQLSQILRSNNQERFDDIMKEYLPKRFIKFLLDLCDLDSKCIISTISNHKLELIYEHIFRLPIKVNGVGSLKSAFVTGGGVSLKELDASTFKHKTIKNLSLCGELLDLHGPIGGYNLTIASLSGIMAGRSI